MTKIPKKFKTENLLPFYFIWYFAGIGLLNHSLYDKPQKKFLVILSALALLIRALFTIYNW